MEIMNSSRIFLVLIAAVGYALASILMKLAATSHTHAMLGVIIAVFAMTAVAEIVLLKNTDLSKAYIAIIAMETLMVLAVAIWLGERLGTRDVIGALMVLGGTLMVSH